MNTCGIFYLFVCIFPCLFAIIMTTKHKKRFSLTIDKKSDMATANLTSPTESHDIALIRPSNASIKKLMKNQSKKDSYNTSLSDTPLVPIPLPIHLYDGLIKRSWLWKWTNYIQGYQKRWFVLDDGTLSYYRSKEEISHSCRGTINLCGAYIETMNRTYFVVRNGTSQVFHLKASSENEKQEWVTVLNAAKSRAIRISDIIEEEVTPNRYRETESEPVEENPLDNLQVKLLDLQNNYESLQRKGQQLSQVINTGDTLEHLSPVLKEKFTLYSLTARSLLQKANEYYDSASEMFNKCQIAYLQDQREREDLANEIESLATQLVELEKERMNNKDSDNPLNDSLSGSSSAEPISVMTNTNTNSKQSPPTYKKCVTEIDSIEDNSDDDEFVDTLSYIPEQENNHKLLPPYGEDEWKDSIPTGLESYTDSNGLSSDEGSVHFYQPGPEGLDRHLKTPEEPSLNFLQNPSAPPTLPNRRKLITPKPNVKMSYWAILRNCIGKDLSKIPMPVHFNEPLSFLQRMVEEFEYSRILDAAAAIKDPLEQLCLVAGFTVSSYSTTINRTTKPFNPLLGETYECDRRHETGWRVLMEQVSHHPPALAVHAEHKDWVHWQDFTASSKFRGKYLTIIPHGVGHLAFYNTGNHYTWRKVTTTVHNIIVGKLWIDQHGEMEIINHKTRDRCVLKYIAYSYFSREKHRRVTGTIYDANKVKKFVLRGFWDEFMEYAPVTLGPNGEHIIGDYQSCWTRAELNLHETMYNFSEFNMQLNEMEPGIAPTDSRLRPDQRKMEDGDFDTSNQIKALLEEKQRAKRREREALALKALQYEQKGEFEDAKKCREESEYKPFWFQKDFDPCTNTLVHTYKGGYWEAKESCGFDNIKTPDIYL